MFEGSDVEALVATAEVKKIIFHPQYNEITHIADLALVKIKPVIKSFNRPLTLPFLSPSHLYEHVVKYQKAFVLWKLKFTDNTKKEYNYEELTDLDIFYQQKADKCPPPPNNPK